MKDSAALSQPEAWKRIQQLLGYTFKNDKLLQRALTHRSFSADHNERLEFLGDSVLGLAVSDWLYNRLQDAPEGDLSRMRANLVRQESLYGVALQLGLAQGLRLGEGELRSGGLQRASILADALEATIGAIYLDAGYEAAQKVVNHLFAQVDLNSNKLVAAKDPKTELQEWLQARKMPLPMYEVERIEGAAHQQTFHVVCMMESLQLRRTGQGSSRRAAEQEAARLALHYLQQHAAQKTIKK